ncbi:MAG: PHP domain-containing protein [Oscillospiraceae bacterium]|nr:PHP domain-containing protein [Oscillospiraceae bacterium]
MKKIDLHIHTTASDGTFTPEEVVREAARLGLAAVAITDHDTAEGYPAAAAEGEELGLEVVPGIEISTKFRAAVHILGYYIDVNSPALEEVLDWMHRDREDRNIKLCAMLRERGVDIDNERMHARFGDFVGRPHFAEIMVENGMARDVNDAFERLLNKNRPYFIPRQFLPIERSVEIIREAGGIPVLAHPFQYRLDDAQLRELIEHCMDSGLEGMECRYTGYDARQCAYLESLAAEYGLVRTGGSDFHGAIKGDIRLGEGRGELEVPCAWLEELRSRRRKD